MRIEAIDLARGWALVGVALVNVHAAALGWDRHYALDLALASGNTLDVIVELLVGLVFSHRAFPVLAFLLGYGVVVQWRSLSSAHANAEEITLPALRVLRARYAALLLIAVCHALLLWPGEILGAYALIVLTALLAWPHSDRALARVAITLLVIALGLDLMVAMPVLIDAAAYESSALEIATSSSFAAPTFSLMFSMHLQEYLEYGLVQLAIPEIWLGVCVGMWAAQSGVLARWLDPNEPLPRVFFWGCAAYVIALFVDAYAAQRGGWNRLYQFNRAEMWIFLVSLPAMFGAIAVTLGVARLWTSKRHALPLIRSFLLAAGKTPLTQFVGQSVVFAIVFNQSLIGWHGALGRAAYSAVALITFVLWAGFARAWLAAGHSRGPMELLWMRLAAAFAGAPRGAH
jgi:uncharacterized protein